MIKHCSCCKKYFDSDRPEGEALLEAAELWEPHQEMEVVCETCFVKIMDFNEPEQYRYAKFIQRH